MKKSIILLVFLLIAAILIAEQLPERARQREQNRPQVNETRLINYGSSLDSRETLLECDFSDVTGWTVTGGSNWDISSSNEAGGEVPELRFSWAPSTTGIQHYISPEINTSGYSSLNLTFISMIDHYSGDYELRVETTSDGGATWNVVWTHEAADMPPSFIPLVIDNGDIGSENFQFAFVFDGDSYNINYWYIDDAVLTDDEIPGTLTGIVTLIPPLASVTDVIIEVDNEQVSPNEEGIYTILVAPGNYDVTASLAGYIPITETVEIIAGEIVVQDFELIVEGTGTIEGTVTLSDGGNVSNVTVVIGLLTTSPDASGFYSINQLPGEYNVTAYLDGYKTLSLTEIPVINGETTTVDPITLDEGAYNIGDVVNNIGFDHFTWDASGNAVFETTDIYREVDNGNTIIMFFHEEGGGYSSSASVLQEAFINFQNNNDDVLVVAPNTELESGFSDEMEQIRDFALENGATYPFTTINQLGHCETEFCECNIVVIGEDNEIVGLHYHEHFIVAGYEALYETGQMSGIVNIIGLIDDLIIDDVIQTVDLSDIFEPEPGTNFTYGGFSTNEGVVTVSVDGSILSINPANECGYFNVIASCEVPGEGTSYAVGVGYGNNDPEWTIFNSFIIGFDILAIYDNCFESDSNGKIYFGNYDVGLESYDGTNWDVLNTANSDLPSNELVCLTIDQDNTVWVGDYYCNVSTIENGEVTTIYNSGNSSLNMDYIFGITSLDNNDIYALGNDFSSGYNKLFKFSGSQWYELANPPMGHKIYSDGENIWVSDMNGLGEYDMENDSWTLYTSANTSFPITSIGDVCMAENGDLWVCSGISSSIDYMWLGRRSEGSSEWEIIQNPNTVAGVVPHIYDLLVHSNGNILIASSGTEHGVFVYEQSNDNWGMIDMSNSPMETNRISTVEEREDSSLWVVGSKDNIAIYSGNGYNKINNYEIPSPNYTLMNFPNPFNPETTIGYSIPFDGKVKISIYNIKGQKVKTLVNETQTAGNHNIVWNGKNSNNQPVSSGVYFYKMCLHPDSSGKAGKFQETKKMILLK